MKNFIIGTAGHIDHGKTTLIKALTGSNTDRLKEEQKRGISIDLGFTHFKINEEKQAGIIDVPGHEKFIKNMLAGVSGMDMVLLVIAADEGVMPQTIEHMNILNFIGLKKGLIVLTKSGLADDDLKELVKDDIREKLSNTFLKDSKIIEVDSIKNIGIETLKKEIDILLDDVETRQINTNPRLYVDRVFSVKGFGTVVTGTLIEGKLEVGKEVVIYPSKKETKIRSIQVHGQNVDVAYAGQRTAINLSNIKVEDINRGDIISLKDSLIPTMMIDCKINTVGNLSRPIKYWERIKFYHGSKETIGRTVLIGKDELKENEEGFVQFRLEEPIVIKNGDKFVVRFYSPMETIAGGVVIDANPKKHKKTDEKIIKEFEMKEKGSLEDIIMQTIKKSKDNYMGLKEICKVLSEKEEIIKDKMLKLEEEGRVYNINSIYISNSKFEEIKENMINELNEYHRKNKLKEGILKEELRNKIIKGIKTKEFDVLLEFIKEENLIEISNNIVKVKGFEVVLNKKQEELKLKLLKEIKKDNLTPKSVWDIIEQNPMNKNLLNYMNDLYLIRVSENIYYDKNVYFDIIEKLKSHLEKTNEPIGLASFRDLIGFSRKYAIILLEHFDKVKVTKRLEDNTRVIF